VASGGAEGEQAEGAAGERAGRGEGEASQAEEAEGAAGGQGRAEQAGAGTHEETPPGAVPAEAGEGLQNPITEAQARIAEVQRERFQSTALYAFMQRAVGLDFCFAPAEPVSTLRRGLEIVGMVARQHGDRLVGWAPVTITVLGVEQLPAEPGAAGAAPPPRQRATAVSCPGYSGYDLDGNRVGVPPDRRIEVRQTLRVSHWQREAWGETVSGRPTPAPDAAQ
jgi:hypothetical protein